MDRRAARRRGPSVPRWLLVLAPVVAALHFVSVARGAMRGRQRQLAAGGEGEHGGGAMNVFAVALSGMDQTVIGWMMCAVIFSQLVLDEILRRVEASVGANARACLREVYKELSTLGLVSYMLFLVQSFETKVNEDMVHAFEYSHIFVFSFAIVYVVQAAVLIASIAPIQRRLIRLHTFGDAVAACYTNTNPNPLPPPPPTSLLARPWFCCLGNTSSSGESGSKAAAAVRAFDGFRAFRRRFLSKHALPPSFLFDRYLIEVYDRWVIVKLDIASWCWALMCFIFGIHALVARIPTFAAFCLNRWTFLAYGWLLLLADAGLFLLVHRVHTRVLRRLRSTTTSTTTDNSTSNSNAGGLDLSQSLNFSRSAAPLPAPLACKSPRASVLGAAGEGQQVDGEGDALDVLRRRRAALHAQRYREQHLQQPQNQPDSSAVASPSSSTINHHSADPAVLRHPPRRWGLSGLYPQLTHSPHDDEQLGFKPWEAFAFNYGTEALNIVRCLYLAAWLCTYAVPAFAEWFSVGWALVYVLAIPVPAIITGTTLIPRMVTRFLLVSSLAMLDLEAFDAVVEYMEEAEAALKDIAHLLQRLTTTPTDTTTIGSSSCCNNINNSRDGVEQLFASLAQQHPHLILQPHRLLLFSPITSTHKPNPNPTKNTTNTAAVEAARAPPPTTDPLPISQSQSTSISYAQLRDFLRHHGAHLSARRFHALARFIDADLCGHIDLEDFRAVLQADHLFCSGGGGVVHPHPAAARVARLLSQQQSRVGAGQGQGMAVTVGRLLRHGSSVLADRAVTVGVGVDMGAEGV